MGQKKDIADQVPEQFPKIISPQAHAFSDVLAFPAMLGLTWWMAQKNPGAAALMGVNADTEGSVSLFTNYPPALVPFISFEDHIRIGILYAPFSMGLVLLPHIPRREQVIISLMLLVPFLLNGLCKPVKK